MDKLSAVPVTWSSAFLQSFYVFLTVLAVGVLILFCVFMFSSNNDIDGIGTGMAMAFLPVLVCLFALGAGVISLPLFKYCRLSYWGLVKWTGIGVGGFIVLSLVYCLVMESIFFFKK